MKEDKNETAVRDIYAAMAKGDTSVFANHVHPDYVWRIAGRGSWSGDYVGQEAIRRDLIGPLFKRFATAYKAVLKSTVAAGDIVVAEVEGDVTTHEGARYNNCYCFIFRFRDSRIVEVTEYSDTDLCERVVGSYETALARAGRQV